ncbi:hypothetical protein BGZ80_002829 [Entomortierella chlamydospora]|uniref:Uncharacterized protein n=1 Tax=Entomortierella chlamydospora TaxID=101097 RepID=A0A9P6MPM8_9FUNG|nr:hypothetical protein BGZ80_002829 [Entomortierella chlamydospora]
MSTDLATSQYPEATKRVDVVFSQPTITMRWIESTTECRHMEALFLLVDDARDAHITQLMAAFPHLTDKNRVVRFANVKLDQENRRPRPKQLFRVETRFTFMGNTSAKFNHRFLTVPKSQAKRDFNNRDEDHLYTELKEGDEPERCFASAEGGLVFVKWQADEKGHRFFRPTPGVFVGLDLTAPPVIEFLGQKAPEMRPIGSTRPRNAFKVQIHLRKSDEDQLGHVTNSRYVGLLHDVLTFGLRTGYYSNGSGEDETETDLPVVPSYNMTTSQDVAVPAGSRFYKRGKIMELYVGYERELKVKPETYVWSWVEPTKIQDAYDVIRFEICSTENGQEQVVSLCRAIIKENTHQRASL